MFRLIAIDFSQNSPHFSLLSSTSPYELSLREVTSPSNLKVVGALDNYSLVFVIFNNFFGQLKDWVGQVLFLVSCPKGQVEKYVNVEACYKAVSVRSYTTTTHYITLFTCIHKYAMKTHSSVVFQPSPTWNFDDVNNQYSYSYVKGAKRNSHCVVDSKVA
jgi:hypothetical protein